MLNFFNGLTALLGALNGGFCCKIVLQKSVRPVRLLLSPGPGPFLMLSELLGNVVYMHAPHDALQHHFPAQRENAVCGFDENFRCFFVLFSAWVVCLVFSGPPCPVYPGALG